MFKRRKGPSGLLIGIGIEIAQRPRTKYLPEAHQKHSEPHERDDAHRPLCRIYGTETRENTDPVFRIHMVFG